MPANIDKPIDITRIGNCCLRCAYARKAANDDYIGCSFWNSKYMEDVMTPDSIMVALNLMSLTTGWVYLHRYPEDSNDSYNCKSNDRSIRTVTESIMTNGVICFEKNFVCHKFSER